MSSDRAIVDAIKVARTLLSQNLPPAYNLPDAATVTRVRELVHSPSIRSALERSSDTLLAFALRAVERVVADQSLTNRQIITRLWDVLDDPHLNQALGIPQNSRITFGPYPKKETLTPRQAVLAGLARALDRDPNLGLDNTRTEPRKT
jgi:hypothetical protein